jgi:hypothetical protein
MLFALFPLHAQVADITSNLSGYWNLDETSGVLAADSSGNNNHGTLVNGPAWIAGKIANGLSFDGVNDYISLGDPVSLRPANFITLAAWVRFNNTSSNRQIISKDDSQYPLNETFVRINAGGAVVCAVGGVRVTVTPGVVTGQWIHLACTYDGSNIRLYVNGVQRGMVARTGTIPDEVGIGWLIGARTPTSPAIFMSGLLDDVRIYSRALSANDISSLFNLTGGGPPTDTQPPVLSGGTPSGTLSAGTTSTTLSVTTDESATCKYSTTAGTAFSSMTNTFTATGATSHSTTVSGLVNGNPYTYYVRCRDAALNANATDYAIAFSVAADVTPPVLSNGAPTGTLSGGTTQTAISLITNENSTCKYAAVSGTTYTGMPNVFSSTGGTSHSTIVSGLVNGTSYTYYVRCRDAALNANTTDFAIAFSVAAGSGTDFLSNLSGYWNLDETSGVLAADSSGNNNHGTLVNGPAWTAGKIANGLSLDGVNDYISLGDPVSLRPANFITLAAWVNFDNVSVNRMIVAKDDSQYPLNETFLRINAGGAVVCAVGGVRVTVTPGVVTGQWIHLACTYDGSNIRVYINGIQRRMVARTGTIPDEVGIGWLIGARTPATPAIFMSGLLDDVRIYSRALSANDIVSLFNFTGGGPPTDTQPPVLSGGAPSGTLSAGTTSTTLSVTTDESATCRYSTTAGTSFSSMTNTFTTTGATSHSTTVSALVDGSSYTYYVRCRDAALNANGTDFLISFSVASSTGNPFQTSSNWAAFDPHANGVGTAPFGFHGGIFDGVYVYFIPHAAGNKEVMRYDTTSPFNAASSWEAYDPHPPSGGGGYSEGAFDGRYVYFAPHDNGVISLGEVLRFDTTQPFPFNNPSSWQAFDPSQNGVGTSPKGYWGALFDGRYVYFAPEWQRTIGEHGEVLRYDTTLPFTAPSSWRTYDPGANGVGTDPDGYKGIITDGTFIYFVPYYNGTASHGEVLRYDPGLPFNSPTAWTTYTPANFGVGNIAKGFEGAVSDGHYIYFVPSYSGNGPGAYHGEVLRYDPSLPFNVPSSWAAFDPGSNGVGMDPDGYNGAIFDGRYIIFAPSNNGSGPHAEVLLYDTTLPFNSAGSWMTFDPAAQGVGTNPRGFAGAVYDGRYIYFVPDRNSSGLTGPHDEVLRYDTRP